MGFVLDLILAFFVAGWRRRRSPISEPVERNTWLAVGAVALVAEAALVLTGSLVAGRWESVAALMAAMATGSLRYLMVLLVPSAVTLAMALATTAWRPQASPPPPTT